MDGRKYETILVPQENIDFSFLVDLIADKIKKGALTTAKRDKEKKTA